jgi:hypothetical protein
MAAQLWTLRVFRWLAILTILVSIIAAGLDLYLKDWSRLWGKLHDGEKISYVIRETHQHWQMVLLGALVWINSTLALKYLRQPARDASSDLRSRSS